MKKLLKVSLLLSMFVASAAVAGPVVVIVNSANTQAVSQGEVKNIYADKTISWANGSKIAVYNLPTEDAAAETFAQKVLGMPARDAASDEANRNINNTSRNPQQAKRDALVTSIVAKNPNAIGYAPKEMAEGKPGIRVLFTLE